MIVFLWACVCSSACCCVWAPPLGREQHLWLVTSSCMDGDIWNNPLRVATENYVSGTFALLLWNVVLPQKVNTCSLMNSMNIVDAPNMLVVFSVNQSNRTSRQTPTHKVKRLISKTENRLQDCWGWLVWNRPASSKCWCYSCESKICRAGLRWKLGQSSCATQFWGRIPSSPGSSVGKESTCNAGDPGSIPVSGISAGEGIGYPLQYSWASFVAQLVKNLPAMRETWVGSLGWEDPLEKGKPTHSSILAWRMPWTL